MLADALTKQKVDPTILKKVLRTGTLKNPENRREGELDITPPIPRFRGQHKT